MIKAKYRGRIAPSPTGHLHIGHAITFSRAQERARTADGKLILRIEDLDVARCRSEFGDALVADLKWFDLAWDEGPDIGGAFAPYVQSLRRDLYLEACKKLRADGFIYPCRCSRKDVFEAALAPHEQTEEQIYPGTCRPKGAAATSNLMEMAAESAELPGRGRSETVSCNWRFRVPDGEEMEFMDERLGRQSATAGKQFGDFVVWRRDHLPAYQLAVVVDDSDMQITEVVRGEDLLLSTFRQLLIYRALNLSPPAFYHTPLVLDENGRPLAKRHAGMSLRELRAAGIQPQEIRQRYL